jgi:hypothetical protein
MNAVPNQRVKTMTQDQKKTSRRCRFVTAIAILLLATNAAAQSYTIAPPPFQVTTDNNGRIINGGCVWTYLAGTTTATPTYSDNAGTLNSNPIKSDSSGRFTMFLVSGTSYKFVYENVPCTVSPPLHGTVLRTADNISGVPSSSATVDITGTAGETISAGQCAYLSDGSGSKVSGSFYKCDSANTYSSSTPTVGLAPSAITSGAMGTIRISGSVSGLSVAVGSTYYVGSTGAISTTASLNKRRIGDADTATTLIVTANPRPLFATAGSTGGVAYSTGTTTDPTFTAAGTTGYALIGAATAPNWQPTAFVDDFGLTFTTATCHTTSDVTAATTLYLTPCTGNRITLFDSSGNPTTYTSAEISIAVPASTATVYDVWVYANAGVPTLELLAWTNATTRATATVRTTTGRLTKSGDLTRLYVGSFETTAVAGQAEDSLTKRWLWSEYNRWPKAFQRLETTSSWTYSTATVRQANGSASNQVDVVIGQPGAVLDLTLNVSVSNSTGGVNIASGIGEDSTTTAVAWSFVTPAAGVNTMITAHLLKYPAVGRHVYSWNEYSGATITTTFFGNATVGIASTSGLSGFVQ